jgi:competence protein CoiA
MRWAQLGDTRIEAAPKCVARCPACGGEVVAKCGELVAWHWAHKAKDCDPWSEPESEWHLGWKQRFPANWQEVVIGPHRADVKTPFGVLEFQRSSISIAKIKEREHFYGAMAWVVDSSEWWLMGQDSYEKPLPDGLARWLWPRKCWQLSSAPVFLDRGNRIVWFVKACYQRKGYSGKETIIEYKELTYRQFLERWSGLMLHKYLLAPSYHKAYGYLKNRPDLLPPLPTTD